MNNTADLAKTLRQLPLEAPVASLWPGLQQHLPKKRFRRPPALALVASIAITLLFWQFTRHTDQLPLQEVPKISQTTDVHALMAHSAQLETAYYAQQDDAISSATVIAANLGIEEQLAAIDARLTEQPDNDNNEARLLWQQRINLLDQGLQLNRTNAHFNAYGRNYDPALASTN